MMMEGSSVGSSRAEYERPRRYGPSWSGGRKGTRLDAFVLGDLRGGSVLSPTSTQSRHAYAVDVAPLA
jgi:hypothetical protein